MRDFITTMHFLMNEGYISPFKMKAIKVDKNHVETYTDDELKTLLAKPNIKKCSFTEYQCWVMTNFLFCTGVRQRSLMFVKVKDIDFDNTERLPSSIPAAKVGRVRAEAKQMLKRTANIFL